jgi:excisionase family DNA binding protein
MRLRSRRPGNSNRSLYLHFAVGRSPEGRRLRCRVSGPTKAAVQDALKGLRKEIDGGVSAAPVNCTVRRCGLVMHNILEEASDNERVASVLRFPDRTELLARRPAKSPAGSRRPRPASSMPRRTSTSLATGSPPNREHARAGEPVLSRLAYTVEEAALVVGVGRDPLYDEIRTGRLRSKKAGSRRVIARHHLLEWLDSDRTFLDQLSRIQHADPSR